jgi:hypothetical protein
MEIKFINICYTRDPMKETRPDACPRASILPLIAEQVGRDSVGIHTVVPFYCLMLSTAFAR